MALNYSGSLKNRGLENSLVVQQSGLSDFTAKGPGSIPGQGFNFARHMTRSEKKESQGLTSLSLALKSSLYISGEKCHLTIPLHVETCSKAGSGKGCLFHDLWNISDKD